MSKTENFKDILTGNNNKIKTKIINKRFLPSGDDYNNILCKYYNKQRKIVLIKSDTGTGKTTMVRNFLKSTNLKFISLTSRVSLAEDHYEAFKKEMEVNFYKNKISDSKSLVCEIESFKKIEHLYKTSQLKEFVLFLDEISSLLQTIVTSPTIKDARETLAFLILMIKNCKFVVGVDANITEDILEFIKNVIKLNYIKSNNIQYIENKFKCNDNINAKEISSYDKFINKLKNEEKFLVCCDFAKDAKDIYERLGGETSGIKLIIADNKKIKSDKILDNYQKVVFSPTIIYGIDSQMKRPVYACYNGSTIGAYGMYQQINRNRQKTKLYFYFKQKSKKLKREISDAKLETQKEISLSWQHEYSVIYQKSPMDKLFEKLHIVISSRINKLKINPFSSFVNKLKLEGFNVIESKNHERYNSKKYIDRKDNIEKCNKKLFEFENNTVNDFLMIPEEKCDDYMDILSDDYKLKNHLNICKFLDFDRKDIINKFKLDLEFKHTIEIMKLNNTKMSFFYECLDKIKCNNKEVIQVNENILTNNEKIPGLDKLSKRYNALFNTKKKIKSHHDIITAIRVISNNLFDSEFYIKSKSSKVVNSDNEKKRIVYFKLKINPEKREYHETLASYRMGDGNTEADFIDEETPEDDYEKYDFDFIDTSDEENEKDISSEEKRINKFKAFETQNKVEILKDYVKDESNFCEIKDLDISF